MGIFRNEAFVSHAGLRLLFKIECDELDQEDIETVAAIIGRSFRFKDVVGIPRGGLRLAEALKKFCQPEESDTLLVDDVSTSHGSMEEARKEISEPVRGVVIFARGQCPSWIKPIFQLAEWARP
ncbi:MAG: hypothetical protein Q8R29_00510 [bacterium]|nr:hypothetical protein [bacterium]